MGATALTFGPGNPATEFSCTATTCTVTAPAHTADPVDVQVTTLGGTSAASTASRYSYQLPPADIDVDLSAQAGLLVPYITYTLTAHNTGPGTVTSATLTASLPAGASANNRSPGCTTGSATVTCAYSAIAAGGSVSKTFRVPVNLLALGQVSVTGMRTVSDPGDPNALNDTATATCTVVSALLISCP
nr:DUF11 domain-containing protein [Streptomyces virginiae]